MARNILTAKTATVTLGSLTFEGVRFEDGSFGISQQQAAKIFSVIPTNAPKWLKSLLGKDFQIFSVKTDRNVGTKQNRPESAISILDFERLIRKLDRKGNKTAEALVDALLGLSLKEVYCDAFDVEIGKKERQEYLKDRILDQPDPWKRLFEKEFCDRVIGWFGHQFYWDFVYCWMTPDERCKLNQVNPVRKEPNGRCDRLYRIHQFIEEETKERLHDEVVRLIAWVEASTSREDFLRLYNNAKGMGKQLPLL